MFIIMHQFYMLFYSLGCSSLGALFFATSTQENEKDRFFAVCFRIENLIGLTGLPFPTQLSISVTWSIRFHRSTHSLLSHFNRQEVGCLVKILKIFMLCNFHYMLSVSLHSFLISLPSNRMHPSKND